MLDRFIKILLFFVIVILVASINSFATYIDFTTLNPAFEENLTIASPYSGTLSGLAVTLFSSNDINFCLESTDELGFSFPIWADNFENMSLFYDGSPGYERDGNCQYFLGLRQISVWNNGAGQTQGHELIPSGVSKVPLSTTMLLVGAAFIGLVGIRRRNLFKKHYS